MTNQVIGEIMFAGVNPSAGSMLTTPWMPVRGDKATFGVEVLQVSGVSLKWFAQTRTREDSAVTALMAEQTLAATGVATAVNTTSAKELVRYVFNSFPVYKPAGPNSNTFVSHIASECGMDVPAPSAFTPGWRTKLDTYLKRRKAWLKKFAGEWGGK